MGMAGILTGGDVGCVGGADLWIGRVIAGMGFAFFVPGASVFFAFLALRQTKFKTMFSTIQINY